MDHALSDLIHRCSNVEGVTASTYTSYYGIQKNFNIPVSKFGEFISGYCSASFEDEQDDMGDGISSVPLYIGECVDAKTTLPLMGNFCFKFDVEEGEEDRSYYTDSLILKIVQCYQRAIGELLDTSPNCAEYLCCVLENHSHRKGEYVKINLLLQFPFCQIDIKYMKTKFKNHVEKLLRNNRVVESFDTPPVGNWREMMFDFEKSVPMYRSSMDSSTPHMKLNHIYGMIDDDHINNESGPELELSAVFNPTTHSFIHNGKIPRNSLKLEPDEDEEPDDFCRFLLPLFLSIHFWGAQTNPKEIENTNTVQKTIYENEDSDTDNPLRMASTLLSILSPERANKDYSWLDIGRVLFNIYNGTEEGLNIWTSFSSRATIQGRDKMMCKYKWSEFRKSNLTVKTLAWYAKEDNPTAYESWHIGWCQKSFNEALSAAHLDVAKAIYRMFWLNYVYSGDTKLWYQFRGNHFYRMGYQPFALRKEITERFIKIYTKMNMELNEKEHNSVSIDNVGKDVEFKLKAVRNLIDKMKNENYRSTVVKSLMDTFHVEEFEQKCDKNHLLTAMGNCILEVVDKRIRPRPGKPEDFIVKYSEIMYPFEYDWDSYWVAEVMKWFDQICVRDTELKHYFLKRLSSFLRGLNSEKLFDVWTNSGNGGKSIMTKTLQYIFGKYFVDFPTSLLMGNGKNSNSGSANPELAQAANARGAILAEPDDRETMKGGIIKRITGGDRIFTRGLHENGGSMEMTFKTIMVCNRIPDIANVDRALINRFVIMPFLGTWCEDAPETEEEQFRQRKFKMDPFFEAKIPELARGLLWIMVQYYKYYAEEGLNFPPIVKEYIKRHWEENDYYLQFIAENIEYAYKDADKKEINTNVSLTVQDIYRVFTRWFKDFYPGMNAPTASQVKSDLEMTGRLGGQIKRGQWLGIQIKQSSLVPQLGNLGIANI
jgi:phage/plasmid-associated DNA primase